jgi:hypothetical protein
LLRGDAVMQRSVDIFIEVPAQATKLRIMMM